MLLALAPAMALWAAALADSLGITHVLTELPMPATATSRPERLLLVDNFLTLTLVFPLLAALAGALATVSFDLRVASWEITASLRLPAPPWTLPQFVAAVLLVVAAVLFWRWQDIWRPTASSALTAFRAEEQTQSISMLKHPAALLPIAMCGAALAVVLVHLTFVGSAPQPDEGAEAHLWQLLMAGQVPIVAFFTFSSLARNPPFAVRVLGLQAAAALAALRLFTSCTGRGDGRLDECQHP
jgi:hypothetical protein